MVILWSYSKGIFLPSNFYKYKNMFFQGLQFTLSIWYSQFLPFLYINRSMIYISQYKPQKFCIKIVILHIKRRKISYFMAIDNFDCRPVCLWSFLSSSKFKRTTTVQSCANITVPIIKKNWSKLPLVQLAFCCPKDSKKQQ